MTKVLLDTDKAAVIEAVSGATVTDAGTPASDDKVLIQDTSDSDNLKYVNIADLPGGGVDVLSNVATDSIIGRTTAGSGDSEELTASATRTFLNVADGATADQDLSGLAVKANVLELDNTTSFTPDADYEPATKKYVDDTGGGDLWGDLVDADIIPDGDETRDLGSAARQFKKIFTEDININNDIILDSGLYTKFLNNDGNTVFEITTGPSDSYVNYTFVRSADTTQTPSFGVWGDDTNVSLNLTTKGTGKVQANGEEVATVRGAVNAQTGTTYTLVIGDEYLDGVRMTNASANTVTIPPNADVALPVGTKVFITQGGAGSTTIAAGAGVTINAPSTVTLAIDEQWESRVCQKTGTNEWLLI